MITNHVESSPHAKTNGRCPDNGQGYVGLLERADTFGLEWIANGNEAKPNHLLSLNVFSATTNVRAPRAHIKPKQSVRRNIIYIATVQCPGQPMRVKKP